MVAAGEAHAAFGGCVGRGTQGTEEGLLPPSAAGVALVHLLEDQLQLELMADESSPLGSAGERHMAAAQEICEQGASTLAGQAASRRYQHRMGTLPGFYSVLVAPPKQARAARPRAPQAPQAARSAAAGGGQQVREIKRHFRFRGFATNIEIRYKST